MIRIKFEVEEPEETPLPIESENERIKTLLSMKFFGNDLNNSTSDTTNNGNNNVCGTLKPLQKLPEKNVVAIEVPKVVLKEKKMNRKLNTKQLDNSITDSVAVGSKSIKTEPAESSLSLTTQLNNSLNIQNLLLQNRIQNGWTTNEQSIPIGTQQQQSFLSTTIEPIVLPSTENQQVPLSWDQNSLILNGTQQQSLLLPKIEPIFSENHKEVPLSLDQSSSIPNLNPNFWDTTEDSLTLDQSSFIPIETQQPQQSLLIPKTEPFFSENHKEVSLSHPIPNCGESTATNCDITTTEMFPGPRSGLGRRAKLNVCYSVSMEPNPVSRRMKKVPKPLLPSLLSVDNSELASNDNDQHSGSLSGLIPSASSTTEEAPPEAAVPLLVGKKLLPPVVPPLTLSLEEKKKALQRESTRRSYIKKRAKIKSMDPKSLAEKRLKDVEAVRRSLENESDEQRERRMERSRQYSRRMGKQGRELWLANATPEQREQRRVKHSENVRQQRQNENEEQRERRLEHKREYHRTVAKQRREQRLANATPEQRKQMRLKDFERFRQRMENETDEQQEIRQERARQYARTWRKQRSEQKRQKMTPENSMFSTMSSSSMNLVMDNSESSTSLTSNHPNQSSLPTNDNNGTVDIGKTISKRKPRKKRFELSMDDSDSGGGGSEESSRQTITTKLPRPTMVPKQC